MNDAATPKFKSRFAIGARAYFQPNLRLVDAATGKTNAEIAAPCEITAVAFTEGKVYYDLNVIYVEKDADYLLPLKGIPSDMICEAA